MTQKRRFSWPLRREQFEVAVVPDQTDNGSNKQAESGHQVGLGDISPEIDSSLQTPSDVVIPQQQIKNQADATSQIQSVMIEAPLSGGNVDKVRIIVRYTEESWTENF